VKWLVVIVLLGGCYDPVQDGHCSLRCASAGKACPDGMSCSNGRCYDNDRGMCPPSDGGDEGCWSHWKSSNGPKLADPTSVLDDDSNLTNPSLTYDGINMFVSIGVPPEEHVHLSNFVGNAWSTPRIVLTDIDYARIRCTLPSSNLSAICVDNANGAPFLRLFEWVVTSLDRFSGRDETNLFTLNEENGLQGDPEIDRSGTELFFTNDNTVARAIRPAGGGPFVLGPALTGFTTQDQGPTISPAADVIVFTRGTVGERRLHYGVRASDTGWKVAPLTVPDDGSDKDIDPELSPDGCRLFVATNRGLTSRNIYAFEITGSL
jgi:hypothetical protein